MNQPQPYPQPYPPAPAPKKRNGCLWAIAALVAIAIIGFAVLVIVAIATTKPTTTTAGSTVPGAPAAQSSNEKPAASEPGATQTAPAPVGTTVSPAKDWTVVVNSSVPNANAQAAAANQFNKPRPGGQFVIVNITVKNGSAKPNTVGSQMKLSMITTSGVASPQSFSCSTGMPQPFNDAGQLQPGASSTGNICFEVQAAEAGSAVLLAEPLFTVDTVKDQRFLAIT